MKGICKHCREMIHVEGDTWYHSRDRYTWCRDDRAVAEPIDEVTQ